MTTTRKLRRGIERKAREIIIKHNKSRKLAAILALSVGLLGTGEILPACAAQPSTEGTWNNVADRDGYETWTSTKGTGTTQTYANPIVLGSNVRWAPIDGAIPGGARTAINITDLTMDAGSMFDLAYKHYLYGNYNQMTQVSHFFTTISKLTMNGDITFRVNSKISASLGYNPATGVFVPASFGAQHNLVTINSLAGSGGTIAVQIGWDPILRTPASPTDPGLAKGAGGVYMRTDMGGTYTWLPVIDLRNAMGDATYQNINVTGQSSLTDSPLYKYMLEPIIRWEPDLGFAFLDGIYAYNTGVVSESGQTASDAQLAFRNVWLLEDRNVFKRTSMLRRLHYDRQHMKGSGIGLAGFDGMQVAEGLWTNVYRGKLNSKGGYGRNIGQTYDGIQVGMDKQREGDFYNGTIYYGFMGSILKSKDSYASGRGNIDSYSVGAYGSWMGNKGHFLNLALRMSKMENDYSFYDSEKRITANNHTWALGLNAQYGYRKNYKNNWFFEPSTGLALGMIGDIDKDDYTLSNGLAINQGSINSARWDASFLVGKNFGGEERPGSAYAKMSVVKDFGSSTLGASIGNMYEPLQVGADKDLWVEFSLGANMQLSRKGNAYVELGKSTGGDVRTDWQVAGGFSWHWDAGATKRESGYSQSRVNGQDSAMQSLTQKYVYANVGSVTAANNATNESQQILDEQNSVLPDNDTTAQSNVDHDSYMLEPITVEVTRPDWEKNLSPGTVSVVNLKDYEGEQKRLTDYLQTIPGLHITRTRGGNSQYAVARVRGSTGAQVGVYVDGVAMNLNSETGVDLSGIPVENVERIEVYRGYIPARFSGAPMGGVINIVTKRPGKAGGSISLGAGSFGKQKAYLEVNAPLGGGSLLATASREDYDGDYSYNYASRAALGGGMYGPLTDKKYTRLYNDHNIDDAMIKWQDKHWTVKVAHKDDSRHLPLSGGAVKEDWPYGSSLEVKQTDALLRYRQQTGNIDWGIQLDLMDSKKKYESSRYKSGNIGGTANYPGSLWGNYDSRKYGGAVDMTWKLGNHLLEFYADHRRETMDVDVNPFNIGNPQTSIDGKYFLKKYKTEVSRVQLQDTFSINRSRDFTITPGVRMERQKNLMYVMYDKQNDWKYDFNIAAKKQIGENWAVKSTWGTYNRFPNFYEIFGDGAYLRPAPQHYFPTAYERGTNWDIGINWQGKAVGAKTDITLTYFHNTSKDMMLYNSAANGISYYTNGGDGKSYGLELESNFKWKRWSMNFSATWMKTEITKYTDANRHYFGNVPPLVGDNEMVGRRYLALPEWEANLRVDYLFPGERLQMFAEYHYTGVRPQNIVSPDNDGLYMESYGVVNLGAKYAISKKFKISAGVNDLFDVSSDIRQYYRGRVVIQDNLRYDNASVGFSLDGRSYYMTLQYMF